MIALGATGPLDRLVGHKADSRTSAVEGVAVDVECGAVATFVERLKRVSAHDVDRQGKK